jgi:hypothetical protein
LLSTCAKSLNFFACICYQTFRNAQTCCIPSCVDRDYAAINQALIVMLASQLAFFFFCIVNRSIEQSTRTFNNQSTKSPNFLLPIQACQRDV